MAENLEQTRKSYDLVAEEYVRRLYQELENMPLDCEVLERFAAAVRDQGRVRNRPWPRPSRMLSV